MVHKMTAMIFLHNHGRATLNQMAKATGIPAGFLFAALESLIRAGNAVKVRGATALYEATDQGHQRVVTWKAASRAQRDPEYY